VTFEVEIEGRLRTVVLERLGDSQGGFRIGVDGTEYLVDAVRVATSSFSLILPDRGARSHEIVLTETAGGTFDVRVDQSRCRAVLNGRRTRRAAGGPLVPGSGEQRLVAPMPGRIVRVLVRSGEQVALRQPLVVIEAMKMENELGAPRAGRVRDVAVQDGVAVEAGQVLVVVE
jgi:biotin carboxyl carrier protein